MEIALLEVTVKTLELCFTFVKHFKVWMLLQLPADYHGFVWCALPQGFVVC